MIHIFPGFLGSSEDFDSLQKNFETKIYDIRKTQIEDLLSVIKPEDYLLGYSLGGRICLEIAERINFKVRKVFLLASNPGLQTEEEKRARKIWEEDVLHRLQESPEKFLSWWNELPVFEGDHPLSLRDLSLWDKVFDKLRLSKQKNYLPLLKEHQDKFLYFYGQRDKKYSELAKNVIAPLGIRCIEVDGGHRLFQNPKAILDILREEIQ